MTEERMLNLLQELISCHSPSGDEREIDSVIMREFETTGVDVWQDGAGNIYAYVPGDGPKIMVTAHKDEIGMIVTHVLDNGRLKVINLGGSSPWKYGEEPVDILTDKGDVVRAILSVGSTHTLTGPISELRDKRALTWDMVTLYTGFSAEEIVAQGIHPGSRAAISRTRRLPMRAWNRCDRYAGAGHRRTHQG